MIDLLVAGGGPVGLATAIGARLRGLDVTVVEPRPGPVDKACGEGLMPGALDHLAVLGVDPPGRDFVGIRYVSGERSVRARFTAGPGRGVRRTDLHDCLRDRACEVGVSFQQGRVDEFEQDADGVRAAGVRARYLVGADGLHSQVRRLAGMTEAASTRQRFGVRQHFEVAPWDDVVEVHWLPDAEVYVTPVGANLVGVAALGEAPLHLAAAIARLPFLARTLGDAATASTLRGAGPLRQRVRSRRSGRVLLVGDAAGYVDALTGEGLRVGFATAEALVAALAEDRPEDYEREWTRLTRSYRWLTSGLLVAAARPRVRSIIVPSARAMPRVFGRIVDSLAR